MALYARIEDNKLVEIFETEGDITTMFHPDLIWVEITEMNPRPEEGWLYAKNKFSPPAIYVPSLDEIKMANLLLRDQLLAQATLEIDPLQDAVDLEEATPVEVAALKKWKQFRVAVNRVDLTLLSPPWPKTPQ